MERTGKHTLCHASAQAQKGHEIGARFPPSSIFPIENGHFAKIIRKFLDVKICLAVRCNGVFQTFFNNLLYFLV